MNRFTLCWLFAITCISIVSSLELQGNDDNLQRLVRRAVIDSGSGDDAERETAASGDAPVVPVAVAEVSGDGEDKTDFPDDTEASGEASGDKPDVENIGSGSGSIPDFVKLSVTKSPVFKTEKRPTTGQKARVEDINTTGAAATKSTAVPVATDKQSTKRADTAPPKSKTESNMIPTFGQTKSENGVELQIGEIGEIGEIQMDAQKQNGADEKKKGGKMNFTVGIAIGVGIGAILAVTIILLLVYRIRKKDSGSYLLDEQSSQKSMLSGEDYKGKEYFA